MRRVVAFIWAILICFTTTSCAPFSFTDLFTGSQSNQKQPDLKKGWVKVDELGTGTDRTVLYQKCNGEFLVTLAVKPSYPQAATGINLVNNSRGCNS